VSLYLKGAKEGTRGGIFSRDACKRSGCVASLHEYEFMSA
jgi:hypothetical protein